MLNLEDVFVPKNLDPFLAAIDVFEPGLGYGVGDKATSSFIVHLKYDRLWKVHAHFVCNIREM